MSICVTPIRQLTFRHQKGIAVVEFAIGVIILLVLMLVAAEAGRAFYTYNTLTKAVRTGVRYIASNALNDVPVVDLTNQKITDTRNMVIYGQVSGGNAVLSGMIPNSIDVVETFPSGGSTSYVQVTASYNFTPIFGTIPALGLGGSSHNFAVTMQAESTMRVQK